MLKRINNFLKNTSGSILPTTAILIVPLMIAAGVAVDYSRYVNMRNDIQTSLDAAGLATSAYVGNLPIPSNLTTPEQRAAYKQQEGIKYARNFMLANVGSNITSEDYTLDLKVTRTLTGDETVTITSDITYNSIFGQIKKHNGSDFYQDVIQEELESIITMGNRTIEVALVMDNSGSMGTKSGGESRIKRMKDASAKLVADLYSSAQDSQLTDPVKFSLVPFSASVNVGPLSNTASHKGKFMDERGFNPVHNENLDWDDTYRTNESLKRPGNDHRIRIDGGDWLTRFKAFEMLGEEWAGCVEMRPWPHNVLDTYVENKGNYNSINNSMDADGDGSSDGAKALFVPSFAPDEPDWEHADYWGPNSHSSRKRPYAYGVDHNDDDDSYRNSYLYDFRDYNVNDPNNHIQLYTNDDPEVVNTSTNTDINNDGIRDPEGNDDASIPNPANDTDGSTNQINRTNWMFKYQSNVQLGTLGSNFGPNYGCTTKPITALTATKQTVLDAIDEMSATGTTNIQQGLTWGWRTLSEGLPFDQGRTKDDQVNLKFIILLTDGANFYGQDGDSTPNESEYGAWGYMRPDTHPLKHALTDEPTHNRVADGVTTADLVGTIYEGQTFDLTPSSTWEFNALMNVHTAQACENVKADGVSIYTIAYDLSGTVDTNPTKKLMDACSGSGIIDNKEVISGVQFYHDAQGADLDDTFAEIASSISAIRITQ